MTLTYPNYTQHPDKSIRFLEAYALKKLVYGGSSAGLYNAHPEVQHGWPHWTEHYHSKAKQSHKDFMRDLNLGSYLQSETKNETIVAEMQQGTGSMGLDLGFEEYDEFASLLKSAPNTITPSKVEESLNKHKSGLKLLLASEQPKDTPLIESLPQYKTIFNRLMGMPNFLLLDFGAGLPRVTQELLPQCDHVIVLIEGVKNTIAHSKLLLADLLELGIDEKKFTVVMNNRFRSEQLLPLKDVEKLLGANIAITFTPAPELHSQAARLHSTGILAQEGNITKQQFKKLAEILTALKAEEE